MDPHRPSHHRRQFLKAGAAMIAALPLARDWTSGEASEPRGDARAKSRLILLGTGGGPTPKPNRAAPAQVIVVGDAAYVIDCGNGVARQLVLAKLKLGIDPERVPDAPPFRPQRGLRQPAPAGLGIRSRDAGRRVGPSSAHGDDAPVSRDERLRHPHAHRRRGAAAAEGPDRHARDHRGGSGDAGRQRQGHGRAGRPSAR